MLDQQRPRLDSRTRVGEREAAALPTRLHRAASRALIVVTSSAMIAACSGTLGEKPTDRGSTPGGSTNGGAGATPGGGTGTTPPGGGTGTTTPPPAAFKPAPGTLRRLTLSQYENSVRDLLGAAVTLPTDLEPDTAINGFASIGASRIAFSPSAIEKLETAALALSQQALTNVTGRTALAGCTPVGTVDDACARKAVTSFGRRAWRRPLTADEVTRYAGVATNASTVLKDFWKGLEYGVAGLLQSPYFLYRVEIGTPDSADPTRQVFNGYETATRLSYFVWNSTPDDNLLSAAELGRISSADGLKTEVERLLASPRARTATEAFFRELLRLADLDELPQVPTVFPQMSATLGASLRTETLRTLDDLVWNGDNDYRNLFDTRTTFLNAELAKLYGVPAPAGTGFVKSTLPDGMRAGLLGQGSVLALNAHVDSTSPTRRGKFVREVLLCQGVPAPPPDVDTTLPPTVAGTMPLTMRQKLEKHRTRADCVSCHQFMDPIGLALENFDGIGAFRTMEVGQMIDASGELDGVTFQDARGLNAAIKNNANLGVCLTRSVFRFATGHVETAGEDSVISALSQKLAADGYRFRSLLLSIAQSPSFRYTGTPE